MRELVAGERFALGETLALGVDVALRPPFALALLALDGARRASGDWPPLDSVARELRPAAQFDGEGLQLTFGAFPAGVERLVVAAFVTTGPGGGTRFRELGSVALTAGDARFRVDLADRMDTAIVLAEIYRHAGGWRFAANGGGFVGGLPALAQVYGADEGWARRLGGTASPDRSSGGDPRPRPPRGGSASGSAVAIDAHHLISNAHVVEDMHDITAAGDGRSFRTELVFADARNDLALLRVPEALPAAAQFRAELELHLGEEVTALGFPLQGLLGSGPQASAGNISGLCGIGNDSTLFQFTAPIASGNSGGPILDASGQVIGLVCSSLNLDYVRAAGSNAENVNFGIKGAVVRGFLHAAGLTPASPPPGAPLARAAMVREARRSLYRITGQC